MATAAYLPMPADRYTPCVRTLRFRGIDLTDRPLRLEVRLRANTPGDPLIRLESGVSAGAEGLHVAAAALVDGVIESVVTLRINKARMEGLPFAGETGEATELAYDLVVDWGEVGARVRLRGPMIVVAGVTGADAAEPGEATALAGRRAAAPWSSATLTFSDDAVAVTIDGADELAPMVATAVDAADRAEGAAAAGLNIFASGAAGLALKAEGDRFTAHFARTGAFPATIRVFDVTGGAAIDRGERFASMLPGQERYYAPDDTWVRADLDADGNVVAGLRRDGGIHGNGVTLRIVRSGEGFGLCDESGQPFVLFEAGGAADLVLKGQVTWEAVFTADGSIAQAVELAVPAAGDAPAVYRFVSAQDLGFRRAFRQRAGDTLSVIETAQPIRLWVAQGESRQAYQANEPGVGGATPVYHPDLLAPPRPHSALMLDCARAPAHPEPQADAVADPATATDKALLFGGWDPDVVPGLTALRDGYDNGSGLRPRGQGFGATALELIEQLDREKGRPAIVRGFLTGAQGGRTLDEVVGSDLDEDHPRRDYAPTPGAPPDGDVVQFEPFAIFDRLFDPADGMIATFADRARPYVAGVRTPAVVEALLGGIGVNDSNPWRRAGALDPETFRRWHAKWVAESQAAAMAATGQRFAPYWLDVVPGTPGAYDFPNRLEATLAYVEAAALGQAHNPAWWAIGPDYHLERGSPAHNSVVGNVLMGEMLAIAGDRLADGLEPWCFRLDRIGAAAAIVAGQTEVRIPFAGRWSGAPTIDTTILPATESASGTTTSEPVFGSGGAASWTRVRGGYPYIVAAQASWLNASAVLLDPENDWAPLLDNEGNTIPDNGVRSAAARRVGIDWTKFVKGFWVYETVSFRQPGESWAAPVQIGIDAVSVDAEAVTIRLDTTALTGLTIEYALNGPGNYGTAKRFDGYTKLAGAWGNIRDSLAEPSLRIPGYLHHNWLCPDRIEI